MNGRKLVLRTCIYLLLIGGTLLFSFPFVWMAATSVKVDRELYSGRLKLKPLSPSASLRSPYVDAQLYADLPDSASRHAQILPGLVRLVSDSGFEIPATVDRETTEQQIARGLYKRLANIIPRQIWQGGVEQCLVAARHEVTAAAVGDVFGTIHRHFDIGSIRVRSQQLAEHELAADRPISQRLHNLTPQVASLIDQHESARDSAAVHYDFTRGDKIVLSNTFDMPFDVRDLQRIQFDLRPDDTWHDLAISVEMLGARYVPDRPSALANYNWMTVTWQQPGPDDTSTRIKTWTVLRQDSRSSSYESDPRKIKLTFELRRRNLAEAWYSKLKFNYGRALDYIPFWRYVRVSLFLVVANLVLTLLASSLVAYAFARINWPGREFCFLLMLATMMIPAQVTMIPHFLIWKNLGAYNTLTPLWLGSAFGNAFFIFLLRQFLRGIPRDLEDAARIDGCGFLRIYWHVMLPLIKPSLAAIGIFTFIGAWNDFMGPLIYIADQRLYPLAFGLYAFAVQVNNNPTMTMAASVLMTTPVIAVFFFAQKYFIQGVTLTGMKG